MSADIRAGLHLHTYRCRTATVTQLRARFPNVTDRQLRRGRDRLREAGIFTWRAWVPKERSWWSLTEKGHQDAISTYREQPRPYVAYESLNPKLEGTNNVGAVFCRYAAHYPDDDCSWEVKVLHPYGQKQPLEADAVISYAVDFSPAGVGNLVRFVEYDTGIEPINTLLAKIKAYMLFRTYAPPTKRTDTSIRPQLLWQRRYSGFPPILVVFDRMPLEAADRRGRFLCAAARSDQYIAHNHKRLLNASYTSLELLESYNPFETKILFDIPSGVPHLLANRRREPPQQLPPRKPITTMAELSREVADPPGLG